MKLSINDPRLTAYALGEIEDARECKEIEEAISQSGELQKFVQDIRQMGDQLTMELSNEASPELSEIEKARMETATVSEKHSNRSILNKIISWPGLSAAAAILLVAVVLTPRNGKLDQTTPEYVKREEPTLEMLPPPLDEPQSTAQTSVLVPVEKKESERIVLTTGRKVGERDKDANAPVGIALADSEELYELSPFTVAPAVSKGQVGYSMTNSQVAPAMVHQKQGGPWNTEGYDLIEETGFRSPLVAPLSTFSIDVDTASYANVRRFLNQGQLPPEDAVRIEELINYFPYADAPPTRSLEEGGDPFAVHMDQTIAPWNTENRLLRIALKGYEMPWEERPASNLVFLLDVSGSMNNENKLPLVKEAMDLLIHKLDQRDRVAVVVYAGASGLVLPSTTANNHETIAHALNNLSAGGSTNAGAGIQLAYKVARDNFIKDGNNRVILCTDGDFNVGQTNRGELADVADKQAEKGISLTILGFGMGNYKDDMLEELSNKGKGSYAYVDSRTEARKVFLQDLTSNLFKIAKDVKIQVEFNPSQVNAYRLIGYENRRLNAEDFNDDKKKAGDIGPGHSIVALYEIVPSDVDANLPAVDDLRYQDKLTADSLSTELATVKLRYKQPDGEISKLISHVVESDDLDPFNSVSEDFRFSASVAAFGMLLSGSENIEQFSFKEIEQIASGAIGSDPGGHRSEFASLVRKAESLENSKHLEE